MTLGVDFQVTDVLHSCLRATMVGSARWGWKRRSFASWFEGGNSFLWYRSAKTSYLTSKGCVVLRDDKLWNFVRNSEKYAAVFSANRVGPSFHALDALNDAHELDAQDDSDAEGRRMSR